MIVVTEKHSTFSSMRGMLAVSVLIDLRNDKANEAGNNI